MGAGNLKPSSSVFAPNTQQQLSNLGGPSQRPHDDGKKCHGNGSNGAIQTCLSHKQWKFLSYHMNLGASSHGATGRKFQCHCRRLLRRISHPCIAHWRGGRNCICQNHTTHLAGVSLSVAYSSTWPSQSTMHRVI